ncbi:MAG: choice-of-anchor Q domain-containing protein [Lacipirellulaceae bacterium]
MPRRQGYRARKLRIESLEDRRLLAGVTVANNLDVVNGVTTSIAALVATPGADGISLREAILATNATAGSDEITFAPSMSGQTITLGGSELVVTEALTIDAAPLGANVTINANLRSRVFSITAATGDVTLAGLNLTGGRTPASSGGGGIRSISSGLLTLRECAVTNNATTGDSADGGGISASNVTLNQSTVSGNFAAGRVGDGGGIRAINLTLNQSTVSGNSSAGPEAWGGGIRARNVTLNQSTVSGNSVAGQHSAGGGIYADGPVMLNQSTVSGNRGIGWGVWGGGGIFAYGAVTLVQSTVSDNVSGGRGGGILANAYVMLTESTVSGNQASGTGNQGGGVFHDGDSFWGYSLSISGSILSGNTTGDSPDDLRRDLFTQLTVDFSLIGTGITPTAGANNVVTNSPLLGPLANNGGPSQTHALLAGSPAINAGDPATLFNSTQSDQRGTPFRRVSGGRIDIGALELQAVTPILPGDYNFDGAVNAADYTVYRDTLGQTLGSFAGADGSGDGLVNAADYDVWVANYGRTTPQPATTEAAIVGWLEDQSQALLSESLAESLDEGFAQFFVAPNSPAGAESRAAGSESAPVPREDDLLLLYADLDGAEALRGLAPPGSEYEERLDRAAVGEPPALAVGVVAPRLSLAHRDHSRG